MVRSLKRSVLTLFVLVVLVLWATPSRAKACWWGGGWSYPAYYGYYGWYSPAYYGYGWYPYYAWSYPYYQWPYYSDYSAYPVYARVSNPSPPVASYYDAVPEKMAAEYVSTGGPAESSDKRAYLTIVVPDPKAQLIVNGQQIESSGTVRHFQSPELAPGNYAYDVQATWRANGETLTKNHTVKVKPGAQSLVDFTAGAR